MDFYFNFQKISIFILFENNYLLKKNYLLFKEKVLKNNQLTKRLFI